MATRQVPSVGRVVHYVAHGSLDGTHPSGVCRAAIVTDLPDESFLASLCVLNPTGMYFNEAVRFDASKAAGTWHWPEYVPAVEVPD